ncbi:hypothetical protein HHI36_020688 [Cryptolaemus montrouzieri]|uniref:Uncharacterized protein n=1 Tax=Cryptolaemus montrouzieri TaxID=559131 RepID=A0ABD2NBN5_9CUCU
MEKKKSGIEKDDSMRTKRRISAKSNKFDEQKRFPNKGIPTGKEAIKRLSHILRCYDDLKVELKALKEEVISPDALVVEINDKDSRSNNLMNYNLEESYSTRVEDRKRNDVRMVNAIIDELTNGVSDVDVTSNDIVKELHVDKSTPDHPRALKVVTSSASKVKVRLKNKANITLKCSANSWRISELI